MELNKIINADAISGLRMLQEGLVQTCITSPPYWGLRAYAGNFGIDWPEVTFTPMAGLPPVAVPAWKGNLGEEPDPLMFVAHIVLIFRAVWRVLRDDGTCWVNFGDTFATGTTAHRTDGKRGLGKDTQKAQDISRVGTPKGLKTKDLCGIPWRVAFALQADGWYLRSDIIWAKPNPMPESVTDRPTKAHEYFFLLTKSKKYFYDAQAVREKATEAGKVVRLGDKSMSKGQANGAGVEPSGNGKSETYTVPSGRNKRTVWTVSTKPLKDAHFAAFPPDLISPCILAGTSKEGQCAECGMPWIRVVEKLPGITDDGRCGGCGKKGAHTVRDKNLTDKKQGINPPFYELNGKLVKVCSNNKTTGWKPQCTCNAPTVPQIVLDPFMGAGTTAHVAGLLQRDWIGLEISKEYAELARRRIERERTKLGQKKSKNKISLGNNQRALFD